VEHGIGPVCSARYYNPLFQPTEYAVKVALGLLAVSGLPDHIIDAFLRQVDNNHVNARQGCNLLIYWASCNYQNWEEVFKCSAVIRALGYTELADKLEIDRTVASLRPTVAGQFLEVFVPDSFAFRHDLMRIAGIKPLPDKDEETPTGQPTGQQAKRGSKYGWLVPASGKAHLDCVLGVYYGGDMACNETGVFQIPRRRRWDLDKFLPQQNAPAPTAKSRGIWLAVTTNGRRLEIHTPFLTAFKDALKNVIPPKDRSWTGHNWEVDLRHRQTIEGLIRTHFGVVI